MADDATADDLNQWLGITPKVSGDGPPPPPPAVSAAAAPPGPPGPPAYNAATYDPAKDQDPGVQEFLKAPTIGQRAWQVARGVVSGAEATLHVPADMVSDASKWYSEHLFGLGPQGGPGAPSAAEAGTEALIPEEWIQQSWKNAKEDWAKGGVLNDLKAGLWAAHSGQEAGQRAVAGIGLSLLTDPMTFLGGTSLLGKADKALVPVFAFLTGKGAYQGAQEAWETLQQKGWTPETLEKAISAGLNAAMAGAAINHLVGGRVKGEALGGEDAAAGRQYARDLAAKHELPPAVPSERELLAAAPEKIPTPALQAADEVVQEALSEGRTLDPTVAKANKTLRAELGARGETPTDGGEVPREHQIEALQQLGKSADQIRKMNPAEAKAELEAHGMKVAEAPAPPSAPEPSLDDILNGIPEEPPKELTAEQRAKADDHAQFLIRTEGPALMEMPKRELLEHLEEHYGKESPQVIDHIMHRVSNAVDGLEYQHSFYDSAQPPEDLRQRPPDFERDGVKQWAVPLTAYDRESANPAAITKVVSWAEDPDTGQLINAGGISKVYNADRGVYEQHNLTHTRRLGLHDLPTSFDPIKAKAHGLGWEEAEETSSSPMAMEAYERYHSRRAEGGALASDTTVSEHPEEKSAAAPQAGIPPPGAGDSTTGATAPEAGGDERAEGAADLGGAYAESSGEATNGGPPVYPGASFGTFDRTAGSSALAPELAADHPLAVESSSPAQRAYRPPPGEAGGPPGPPNSTPLGGPPPAPETPSAYEPRFKNSLDQKVHDAVRQVMSVRGLTLDRTRWPRVTDQIIEQLASGEIPAGAVKEMWRQHGISEAEGLRALGRGTTVAAQILNRRSQLARLFGGEEGRAGTRDVLNQAVDIQGYGAHGWEWAYDMATHTTRGMVKTMFVGASTLWHAAGGGLIRTGLGGLIDTVDLAWHKALGVEYSPGLRPRPFDSLKAMSNAITGWAGTDAFKSKALGGGAHFLPDSWRAEAAQMRRSVEVASSAIPVRGTDRLYLQAVREVAASPDATGVKAVVERGVAGLENISTKLLTLHRVMDSTNTVGVFSALMTGALEEAGHDSLTKVVKTHEALIKRLEREHGPDWAYDPATYQGEFLDSPDNLQAKITPEMMQRVVDRTMEYMSRERPNPEASTFQKAAHGLLTSINNSPALAVMPVPGLQYSVMKFLWDSTAGGLQILSKTERARMARGESLAISRAMVGTGIAVGAIFAVEHYGTGSGKTDEWYKLQIPGGGGKTLDIRPVAHLAPFFYVAHLINKAKGDRSWAEFAAGAHEEKNALYKPPPFEEVAKVALNANLRAGSGLQLIDDWFSSFGPEGMNWDAAKQAAGTTAGTIASNFLTPLSLLVDLYAQYDGYARDTKELPFLGPILNKLPGGKAVLPYKYTGLKEAPPEYPAPYLHSFGGVAIDEPSNLLELEIQRTMLAPNQVFPRHTGDAEADNIVRQYMGKVAQEDIIPLLQDEPYRSLDPYRRGRMLELLLAGARKRALAYAASDNPKVFETLAKRKPKNLWVRLLKEDTDKPEAAANEPPPPPQASDEEGPPPYPYASYLPPGGEQ